ncbi:MAG: preprotein translocase subunit YajC [Oscillospiraceae bacterium]|nr:preprotein translocase subunit YajC [Oscillospiraceae bacterium]
MFLNYLVLEEAAALTKGSGMSSIIMMVVIFAAMYFLMIRPQKKKQKEEQEMRDSIQIGDEITTIGGIMGRVVTVKDDCIVLETGADRVKMRFQRWAIQSNDTAQARMEAERKAAEDAKKSAREQDAIDTAVNGKRRKKVKKVDNIADMKAQEDAEKAENNTEE